MRGLIFGIIVLVAVMACGIHRNEKILTSGLEGVTEITTIEQRGERWIVENNGGGRWVFESQVDALRFVRDAR